MKRLLCAFCCIWLLCSCEYKIHENFIEVEKPQDSLYVSIDLNALTDGQTIFLNKETALNYSLSAFGKEIKDVRFKMGNKVWSGDDIKPNGAIYINSVDFPSGTYTLDCEMFVRAGSGSIADQIGAEGAVGKKSWPVVVDYGLEVPGMFMSRTNEEGFFELTWPQLAPTHLKLKSYAVYRNYQGNYDRIIVAADKNYFVDKEMLGGTANYYVEALLDYEGKEELVWPLGNLDVSNDFEFRIVESDIKTVTVYWKAPYKSYLSFRIDEDIPFTPDGLEGTFEIPVTRFGSSAWWDLSKLVVSFSPVDNPSQVMLRREFEVGSPGIELPDERGGAWAYSPVTGLLYATNNMTLNSYLPQDVRLQKTYRQDTSWDNVIASPVSNKVVVFGEQALVLDGNTLSPINSIRYERYSRILGITNDDKLLCYSYAPDGITCTVSVYDLDGTKIGEISFKGTNLQMSPDGKYLLYQDSFDVCLLSLKDYQETGRKILPLSYADYSSYRFSPAFPDQILVQFGDRLNIYHSPDFTLLKEIKREDEMTLEDIDPSTGNLLFYNSKRLKIVDSQSGQELLAMDAATFPWVHLLGNTLVSFDGFVFNIEKYLPQ